MGARKRSSIFQDSHPEAGWHHANWTARSLVAAAGVAFAILLTALSATASNQKAEAERAAQAAIADEAALVADYAKYLAAETANARESLDAPRLKPAKRAETIVAEQGARLEHAGFDFAELTIAKMDAAERRCLAQAIYYEARGESRVGQLAVADVVLNRVASPVYPSTICRVVYEGSQRTTGCQFSFTCDGSMKLRLNQRKWKQADELAGAILAGLRVPVSRNATHYHADYVSPPWAETLTPTATIGTHKFYKFPARRTVASAADAS